MRPDRDTEQPGDGEWHYGADPRLFLPAAAIAALYGVLWISALATGKGATGLAQALLLVVLVVVPVLLIRGWLRYRALELRIVRGEIRFTAGLLKPEWTQIPLAQVTGVRTVYGAAGKRFGSGALILTLDDASRVRIADVANLEDAARRIRDQLRVAHSAGDT